MLISTSYHSLISASYCSLPLTNLKWGVCLILTIRETWHIPIIVIKHGVLLRRSFRRNPLQIHCTYDVTLSSISYFSADCKYFTRFHEWLSIFWLFFDILFHTTTITSSFVAIILLTNSIFNTHSILTHIA